MGGKQARIKNTPKVFAQQGNYYLSQNLSSHLPHITTFSKTCLNSI